MKTVSSLSILVSHNRIKLATIIKTPRTVILVRIPIKAALVRVPIEADTLLTPLKLVWAIV